MKLDPLAKTLLGTIACMAVGLFLYAVAVYPQLPERIPMHFNAAGDADGFAPRSWGAWLMLPGFTAFLCLVWVTVALSIFRMELKHLKLPNKDAFLALPRVQQEELLRGFAHVWLGAGIVWGVFGFTLFSNVYRVAMGRVQRFDPIPLGVEVAVVLIMVFAGTASLGRRIQEAVSRRP